MLASRHRCTVTWPRTGIHRDTRSGGNQFPALEVLDDSVHGANIYEQLADNSDPVNPFGRFLQSSNSASRCGTVSI
jgi:hypothetical protein